MFVVLCDRIVFLDMCMYFLTYSLSGCGDYFAPTERAAIKTCRDTVMSLNLDNPIRERVAYPRLPRCNPVELDGVGGKDAFYQVWFYFILVDWLVGMDFSCCYVWSFTMTTFLVFLL